MRYGKILSILGTVAVLAACGGGDGGGSTSPQPSVVTPPIQVGDFSVGKFSATGDTVLKPNFYSSGQAQGGYGGTIKGIQAALIKMDFQNLGYLNTPEASKLWGFVGSVAVVQSSPKELRR